ncbi:MAG: multicopper oxidase domain-containing protein [Planctomycetes bacterium]|nr:multicopper oxidase domain-containing protein [Planctomycetota bacterium]
MWSFWVLWSIGFVLASTGPSVLAQSKPPTREFAYQVRWAGELKNVMMKGDLNGVINLKAVAKLPNMYAVGALEGLEGEVTIVDSAASVARVQEGKVVVNKTAQEKACVLVYAQVKHWTETPLPKTTGSLDELESFVVETAKKEGIDVSRPFPFLVKGKVREAKYHVLRHPGPLKGIDDLHGKAKVFFTIKDSPVDLVGFYSDQHLGIFTCGGNLHVHVRSADGKASGHLDEVVLGSKMRLYLPAAMNQEPKGVSPKPGAKKSIEPDVELELTAAPDELPLFKGKKTPVWRFQGKVIKGRKDALSNGEGYLGPTIRLNRGERVRIHFVNKLDEPSIIHWHGLVVPDSADGMPRSAIKPGERFTYDFTVKNSAGTYPYHPHPHMRTGPQVYSGLAGVMIIRDPEHDKIGLPTGEQDLCVVVQDKRVNADNRFIHAQHMMDQMIGVVGPTIMVNGRPDASFRIERRPYRLRLVNASNARIYKLAWSDGSPMHVIGTDGGLLAGDEGPQKRPFVVLGPFERVELWEDFSSRKRGAEISLVSEKFTLKMGMGGMGGMKGMMPGMMMGMSLGGEKLQIARLAIQDGDPHPGVLPKLPGTKPNLAKTDREIRTTIGFRMMRGFLNGRTFKENDLTLEELLTTNDPVTWTFDNASEMGMQMPHPIHIHGVQFRVIERKGNGAGDLAKGVIDDGWKDTVLVFAGETVKFHVRPTQRGMFIYHCHNLEHEDMGMMRNFLVAGQ